jgi:hypothetical protein
VGGRLLFPTGAELELDGMARVRNPVQPGEHGYRVTQQRVRDYWAARVRRGERAVVVATRGDRNLGRRPMPDKVPAAEADLAECRRKLAEASQALNPVPVS